ncbi:DUF2062 domain-containing protein [Hymenobacter sp. B1770]|uniref:DUF2062 domain-containing protein n=1 Tax=Hymenobacter sp. B1770 TaxID=1718788 RepID=UPI003CF6F68C
MLAPEPLPSSAAVPPPAPPRSWVYRRVLAPFLNLLKAGLSPEKLALTVSLGVAFGLVPTFGVTSVVSAATALRLQLNVPAMQLVAHLMSAFQLLLLVPLLRAGAFILGHGHEVANLTLAGLRRLITHDGWGAVGQLLWRAQLGALLIWAVAAVPLVAGLYYLFRAVFRRVVARQAAKKMTEG